MSTINRVCLGMHVREPRWSSSPGDWALILNSGGTDVLNTTVPYGGGGFGETKLTIGFEARSLPPEGYARVFVFGKRTLSGTPTFPDEIAAAVDFDTAGLDASSARFDLHGNDLVRPLHMLVWGVTPAGAIVPITLDVDMAVDISDDWVEGPGSIPLSLVDSGDDTTPLDEVLLYVALAEDANAPTRQPVSFRVEDTDGALRFEAALENFFTLGSERPNDNNAQNAMLWRLTDTSSFSRADAHGQPVVPKLRVSGPDNAMVQSVVAFGVNRDAARARVVPLVHHVPKLAGANPWVGTSTTPENRDMLLPLCTTAPRQ